MKCMVMLLFTLCVFACRQKETKSQKPEDSTVHADIEKPADTISKLAKSFFDSIRMQYDLSISRVNARTIIDSVYYTGRYTEARFTGDSLYITRAGHTVAIIKYDDRLVCTYKFLLVFDPVTMINTDYQMIYSGCDRDFSSDYVMDDYRLINDSVFETIEISIPPELEEDSSRVTKNRVVWKINHKGLIDSIPGR